MIIHTTQCYYWKLFCVLIPFPVFEVKNLKLWSFLAVPHFEKMLYDQGQLANVYLDAFSITNDVSYSYISRDILDYLRRDMIGPRGEIFSAEDADSAESEGATRKKEGAFYIWTSKEVLFLIIFG